MHYAILLKAPLKTLATESEAASRAPYMPTAGNDSSMNSLRRGLAGLAVLLSLGGCATYPEWMPASGPNTRQIQDQAQRPGEGAEAAKASGIQLVEVNDGVARQLLSSQKLELFSESFKTLDRQRYLVGAGDTIEASVWEAPPAMLFGVVPMDGRMMSATAQLTTFPTQMIDSEGFISLPFAGPIQAAGRTVREIEEEIVRKLKGKTNRAQVLVRVISNATANVTVVGEVNSSLRMPLTAKGERLLDALAAAGGVRQPVNKMTLQVTRNDQVRSLPLDTIIRDPRQNIEMRPGDVVTALFQPLAFTVLGATGKNEEVNFEAQGISLTQALARAGGLQDQRADARGVFVFRFEDAKALDWAHEVRTTPDGKVPVIYQVDLSDPASFFIAQSFPIQNKDLLYVSNAPGAELQKFLNIVMSVAAPVLGIINLTTR
jgi:polysaccharide export outer membrane protein